MINVLCYEKCSTCKKALKWLDDNNIKYVARPIKTENPTYNEIKTWHEQSNLDIKKFFNTSGMLYRELNLATKLDKMSLEEKYKLLASDGMLVKRPLIITDKGLCPGFKQDVWKKLL